VFSDPIVQNRPSQANTIPIANNDTLSVEEDSMSGVREGLIMDVQKQDTPQGHRFVIETEAGEAELTLARVGDGVFNANHTYTPRALRGQGVAGKLYDAMITDAKAEGYKIIPGCPYIEVKFKRHPEDRAAVGVTV